MGRLRTRRTTAPSSLRPTRPGTPAWSGEPDRVTTDTRYHHDEAGDLSDAFDRRRGWLRYTHDDAGRLLAVEREKTGEREAFRYDPAGNLHDASPEPAREARTYGPGGRLLRRGATDYAWDAAGRLVERRTSHPEGGDEVWRYIWDAAGRLTGVERPDGELLLRACQIKGGTAVMFEVAYIPDGRRKKSRAAAGGECAVGPALGTSGLGLALPLARQLLALHGGSVAVVAGEFPRLRATFPLLPRAR